MPKIFFANWKTYLGDAEAEALARTYAELAAESSFEVVVAPSFTALGSVAGVISSSSVSLGAQDAFWNDEGAHTGEIAPKRLAELGVKYVIVGHSERRELGESDDVAARKAVAVAADGMTPVLCVGELKAEREAGIQEEVVRKQLKSVTGTLPAGAAFVVAYEPRWAISPGTPCEPSDVASMHAIIRSIVGEETRIMYGGSVNPKNFRSYLELNDVDGLLVGAASTRSEDVRAFLESSPS